MQFSFHHHKRIARRAAAVILLSTALVCSAGVLTPAARVQAATSAELKKKRNQTQSQLNSARNKASSLKNEQDSVSEELAQKTKEIAENMTAISMMQDQISDLEDQIKVKQQEYEAARADEQQQYESMKKRIQFMYEKGNTSYVQLLLQASSLGDALNKAEYVERLYDYDRKMLKKYEQTVQQVADAKKALEDEKSELETTQAELKENETELESQQSELQSKYDNYDELIAEAQSEAALLKQQVQQENAQISTAGHSRRRPRQPPQRPLPPRRAVPLQAPRMLPAQGHRRTADRRMPEPRRKPPHPGPPLPTAPPHPHRRPRRVMPRRVLRAEPTWFPTRNSLWGIRMFTEERA